jgi:hypothetical protein
MQKLAGISSGKNNKSCEIFHKEPKKIGFAFFYFSMIFYAIYKKQPKHLYYLSYPFAVRPSERTSVLQCGPWGAASGGPVAIPAGDRRIPAEGGWGSVLWASRVRFGAWLVKKGRSAGALRGSRRWPPLERLLRHGGQLGGGLRAGGELWVGQRRVEKGGFRPRSA